MIVICIYSQFMKWNGKESFSIWYHCLGFDFPPSSSLPPPSLPPQISGYRPSFPFLLAFILPFFMATSTKIHPATLATNIKTYVPIQLDEEGIKFNTWVTLFKLHCRTNLVDDHLIPDDSSKPSVPRDAEWQHLDDIVRTWLYGTISSALLSTIVCPKDCALDTWNRIENNFKTIKLPVFFILNLNSMNFLSLAFLMLRLIVMNFKIFQLPLTILLLLFLIVDWPFNLFMVSHPSIVLFDLWCNI